MRELLTAVKVHFTALGPGAKVLRSRTVAWKCDDCLKVDPYYNLPAFSGAPGMKSESLERVREAEANGK
jgi:hypothetical protein